jgi:hypothetical protein
MLDDLTFPLFDLQRHHERVEVPTQFDLRDLCRKFEVFPLKLVHMSKEAQLLLAMKNPLDQEAIKEVESRVSAPIIPIQADSKDIQWLISTHFFGQKLAPPPSNQMDKIGIQLFEKLYTQTSSDIKRWV